MKDIIIITPIWKNEFSSAELENIQKSLSFNSNYDHVFIHDNLISLEFYKKEFKTSNFIELKQGVFNSVKTYNTLMLSSYFYKLFIDYKYILILQSDAVLVKPVNELFDLNYDFIGPNWKNGFKIGPLSRFRIISTVLKFFGVHNTYFIGNGGLSLRKVDVFIKLTQKDRLVNFSWLNEDMVFSKVLVDNNCYLPLYEDNFYFVEEIILNNKTTTSFGYHAHHKFQ